MKALVTLSMMLSSLITNSIALRRADKLANRMNTYSTVLSQTEKLAKRMTANSMLFRLLYSIKIIQNYKH